MHIVLEMLKKAKSHILSWSWLKQTLMSIAVLGFLFSNFMFITPWGTSIREQLAEMFIITQHREWAWLFVGAKERDAMVNRMWEVAENNSKEAQDLKRINLSNRKVRSRDELIKVVDIQDTKHSTPIWKGKMMYVYDPRSIRVVTTSKFQEGEKVSDMVKRTGAVAGVNGGAFADPEGLGNGFAPIGFIKSAGQLLYNDRDGSIPMMTVGFNKDGILVIGKYSLDELDAMNVTDAVFWQPRIIANGKALPVANDGRNPRTAVGQRRDGTVIFIVIDGRSSVSLGATQEEVQELFMAEDVDTAGFLDGGASSELVVEGQLLTKPSSKYGERRLPSAFLVFDHPENYKPIRIWDGIKSINPGGSFDHPEYQKDLADQRARGLLNSPTPTPKISTQPSREPEPSKTPTSSSNSNSPTPGASSNKTSPTPAGGGGSHSPNANGDGGSSATPNASPKTTTSPSSTPATSSPQPSGSKTP